MTASANASAWPLWAEVDEIVVVGVWWGVKVRGWCRRVLVWAGARRTALRSPCLVADLVRVVEVTKLTAREICLEVGSESAYIVLKSTVDMPS